MSFGVWDNKDYINYNNIHIDLEMNDELYSMEHLNSREMRERESSCFDSLEFIFEDNSSESSTNASKMEEEEEREEKFTAEVLVIPPTNHANPLGSVLSSNLESNNSFSMEDSLSPTATLPSAFSSSLLNKSSSEGNEAMDLDSSTVISEKENSNKSDFYDENKTMAEAELLNNNNHQSNHSESADSVLNGMETTNNLNVKNASKNSAFQLESGARIIAHPSKVAKGGEDAYFLTSSAIGVADGVGGWNEIGIDPSLYSRKMMEGAEKSVREWKDKEMDPVIILREAFDYVTSFNVIGSTTVCIVTVENGLLRASNLGDSGFLVVRGDQIIYRTKEQQFSFNFPYQIGTNSDCLPESHADRIQIEVKEGDIIIAGSDGLFDNMFDEEILQSLKLTKNVQEAADQIANTASSLAREWLRLSPFAKQAHLNGLPFVFGGKLDDITVVVSRVISSQNQS